MPKYKHASASVVFTIEHYIELPPGDYDDLGEVESEIIERAYRELREPICPDPTHHEIYGLDYEEESEEEEE